MPIFGLENTLPLLLVRPWFVQTASNTELGSFPLLPTSLSPNSLRPGLWPLGDSGSGEGVL